MLHFFSKNSIKYALPEFSTQCACVCVCVYTRACIILGTKAGCYSKMIKPQAGDHVSISIETYRLPSDTLHFPIPLSHSRGLFFTRDTGLTNKFWVTVSVVENHQNEKGFSYYLSIVMLHSLSGTPITYFCSLLDIALHVMTLFIF